MARELLITPRGVAVYPRLSRPDTKFKEEGEYKVSLRIPEDDAAELVAVLEESMQAALKEAQEELAKKGKKTKVKLATPPWKDDNENPGCLLFNFKMKASGVEKESGRVWSQKPSLVDAKGKIVSNDSVEVGSGSEGKVSFFVQPFYTSLVGAGISLKLKGFQILKYVEYSGGMSAAALGFSSEEDGFEFEGEEENGSSASSADFSAPADADAIPEF
jgi:hypothetical protein